MSMSRETKAALDLAAAGAPDLSVGCDDDDTRSQFVAALVRSVLDEHREHHLDVARNCWSSSCRIADAIEART